MAHGKKKQASDAKTLFPQTGGTGGHAGADLRIGDISIDIDAKDLPREVVEKALESGGYPYDKRMKRKQYEKELRDLQIELLKLQTWARESGARIVVVFEGRDSAGKGGTIHRFTQHLNPRSARVAALPKPSEVEAGEWYFQRYVAHLPTAGEIVFFDRSWYNRAVVEPVMGFCTAEETERFLEDAPVFERMLVDNGILLFKLWLTIGREMQVTRLFSRRHDPLKRWKLSPIDYDGLPRWDAYGEAAERMIRSTDRDAAPWTVIRANDKRRLRLAALRAVLDNIDYKGRDEEAVGEQDRKLVSRGLDYLAAGNIP